MENPIFAISDAQDNDRTLILGMEVTEKHFNTTKVCYLKPTKVSDLHNVCTNSMDMHLKASKSKKNDVRFYLFYLSGQIDNKTIYF